MFVLKQETTRAIGGKPTSVKVYENSQTGTSLTLYHLYTDRSGQKWWAFEDLFTLPFVRQLAAKKVIDLYGHGLTLDDIRAYSTNIKGLLKGNDPEKYEKIYAKMLEFDTLAETMADPVKQCIGLCTLYILMDGEKPDAYDQHLQRNKMSYLAVDLDAQAFFLNWWTGVMRHSGTVLKGLSKIASTVAGVK